MALRSDHSSLRWVRVDTALPRNHKIVGLLEQRDGYRAAFVFVCALAYCGEQGTGGFIPRNARAFIHARPADVNRLVEARLFVIDESGGGWLIPDWAEFQPSNEEMMKKSERARHAASVRWAKDGAKK